MEYTTRPDFVRTEHLIYLDELHESGVTNMYGATSYIVDEFGIKGKIAQKILSYWMKTFSERHAKTEGKES